PRRPARGGPLPPRPRRACHPDTGGGHRRRLRMAASHLPPTRGPRRRPRDRAGRGPPRRPRGAARPTAGPGTTARTRRCNLGAPRRRGALLRRPLPPPSRPGGAAPPLSAALPAGPRLREPARPVALFHRRGGGALGARRLRARARHGAALAPPPRRGGRPPGPRLPPPARPP